MVSALIAHAQDAAPAAAATETAAAATEAAAPTPAPDVIVAQAATTPVAEPAPAPAATAPAATAPAAEASAAVGDEAQLIVIDDTPLLDAIRNLARQAGLNLMIDPKVAFGQPDPAKPGSVTAQPNVTIRWENITAEQAFNALLNNYNLQAETDPKNKITRVTMKDAAAPDPRFAHTIQLQYASPSNMMEAVKASIDPKYSKVIADVRTSQLVVVVSEKELVEVEKLIAKLDTKTKQVLIEAKIIEANLNPKTSKGIDWTGTLAAQNVRFGNSSTFLIDPKAPTATEPFFPGIASGVVGNPGVLADTANGFGSVAFLNADGLSATLSFLNTHNDTKVVSEPRMVTLDNQKATIDVGLLFPIVNVTAGTANAAGGSEVSYTNLTVNLDITPRVAANNQVELKVHQSLMRLGPVFSSVVGDRVNEVNAFLTRQVNTVVLIPSAHTLVLGGLISDENLTQDIKVPILGDIPLIGGLFRKNAKERNRNNLIVFITPTIVGDEDYQPTTSTYLQTRPENTTEPDWNAWDSGKHVDWSKPKDQAAAE